MRDRQNVMPGGSAGHCPAPPPSVRVLQISILAASAWAGMYARSALGPLQETVKGVLLLSDNQTAFLQGTAMAIPMVLGSIPIGILADRVPRVVLLRGFLGLALSSFLLSALAPYFGLLIPARGLAGLSSIALLIAAYSLAGDLYSPAERGRASTALVAGEILGSPAAFALGGFLLVLFSSAHNPLRGPSLAGWRSALLWMGIPVIPILGLALTVVREPPRTGIVTERLSLRKLWPTMWRYRAVAIPLLSARAMVWIADGAVFVWGAPLFARKFHMTPDKVGALMGTALLISGLLGPLLGGALVDACHRHGGPRRTMHLMAIAALLGVPAALFPFMPTPLWTCALLALFVTLGITILTGGIALSIIVIPGELRGAYLGISLTAGALFFIGLAPLMVSELSGLLGGESMIGHALAIVCATASVLGATLIISGARRFPEG